MTYREIVRTCSHCEVAQAAVDSLGGPVAVRIHVEATRLNVSRGVLVAQIVRSFAASADEAAFQEVSAAAHKSEVPVLSGLRYILERELDGKATPAWMIAACQQSL